MTNFITHSDRFRDNYSTLLNGPIFSQMIFGSVFISTSMFMVHMVKLFHQSAVCNDQSIQLIYREKKPFQSTAKIDSNYFIARLAAVNSIFAILPHCYYSTHVTHRLQKVADDIYSSSWYKLPARFQRYYILSIAAAQPPRFFTGFGLMSSSLETFMKVIDFI